MWKLERSDKKKMVRFSHGYFNCNYWAVAVWANSIL